MKARPAIPPDWAYRPAGPADRRAALSAYESDRLRSNYADAPDLKAWARRQGWRTPWLSFQEAFFEQMLGSDQRFELALAESGIRLAIPAESYELPPELLEEMDSDYAAGRFVYVVEELRAIRRAVELGVVVAVDGRELNDFNSFYTWAHGRYYRLEDDMNTGWIGDDSNHR